MADKQYKTSELSEEFKGGNRKLVLRYIRQSQVKINIKSVCRLILGKYKGIRRLTYLLALIKSVLVTGF
jgi:hypothetical protein